MNDSNDICKELQLKLLIDPPLYLYTIAPDNMNGIYINEDIKKCTCVKCLNSAWILKVGYAGKSDTCYYLEMSLIMGLFRNFYRGVYIDSL